MLLIETTLFTQQVNALMSDDEYSDFQRWLAANPDIGEVIPGTGGLRKVRVGLPGRGKRGGARVIYFHRVSQSQILLLMVYAKNDQTDLTPEQAETLKRIVQRWR